MRLKMKKKRTTGEQKIIKISSKIDDLEESKKHQEIEDKLKYGKIVKIEKLNKMNIIGIPIFLDN